MSLPRAVDSYLVPWTQLDWPLEWNVLFGRSAPLRAELGFGGGEFLERSAEEDPRSNWVGIEVSWFSVRRLLRRLDERGLENVRVVQGDAAFLLEHLFPAGALEEIIINHSDPWPKKRHHSRRLVQARFLQVLSGRLRLGGRVVLATDHVEYADWIAERLGGEPSLRSGFLTPRVHRLPGRPATKYERRGLAAGLDINYFLWEKVDEVATLPSLVEKVDAMPNVLLQGPSDLDALLADLEPRQWREERGESTLFIQLLGAYRRADGMEWLVEARVDEEGFLQHLVLSVSRRGPDRILLKPASIGFPRPTRGIKQAVRLLAEALIERQPELRVVANGVGLSG